MLEQISAPLFYELKSPIQRTTQQRAGNYPASAHRGSQRKVEVVPPAPYVSYPCDATRAIFFPRCPPADVGRVRGHPLAHSDRRISYLDPTGRLADRCRPNLRLVAKDVSTLRVRSRHQKQLGNVRFSNRPVGVKRFQTSPIAGSMSSAGSRFSTESAPGPFHHGIRGRGGTLFATVPPLGLGPVENQDST